MSNHFYNYSGAFIPGILARAEAEATEFNAVQAGFALLDYQGVDSGAANAYVITTQGAPNGGAYQDGQNVQFKAANSNTGASTINVNSIGVVNLLQPGGGALTSGYIAAGTWYNAIYDSSTGGFELVSPITITGFTGTISPSPPTHKVGLTASGGTATAAAPIDATYAIDLTISPTWQGAHNFNGSISGVALTNYLASPAAIGGTTPAAGAFTTLSASSGATVTGAANAFAITAFGSSVATESYGLAVHAGTSSADWAVRITNQSLGAAFVTVYGDGGVVVGSPTGSDKGLGSINTASLYVNGINTNFVTGSFIGTLTGCTTAPTATFNYTIIGNQVTLFLPVLTGTSNSTALTVTGLPAAIQPATQKSVPVCNLEDSSSGSSLGLLGLVAITNVLTFNLFNTNSISNRVTGPTVFTNSGTKGLSIASSITYDLN